MTSRTTAWRRKKARSLLDIRDCCVYHQGLAIDSSDESDCVDGLQQRRDLQRLNACNPYVGHNVHCQSLKRQRNTLDISSTHQQGAEVQRTGESSCSSGVSNDPGCESRHQCSAEDISANIFHENHHNTQDSEDSVSADSAHDHPYSRGRGGGHDSHDSDSSDDDEESDWNNAGEEEGPGDPGSDDPEDGNHSEEDEDGYGDNDVEDDEPGDPGDPGGDDPQDPDNSDDSSDEEAGNFAFDDDLNINCESVNNCSVREVLALKLALATRHSMSYEALINMFKVFNTIHGQKYLPVDKKKLWTLLGRQQVGIVKTVYCSSCLTSYGRLRDLPDNVNCPCGETFSKKKCKVFLSLNLRRQLSELLRRVDVKDALRGRNQDQIAEGMKDICDGQHYRFLRGDGNALELDNFSYTFSTDGFRLHKSSSAEAWPIFIRWNELPWKLRQKYVLLAGVWVDLQHPNMNLFFENFVIEANRLSNDGVMWEREPGTVVTSKFVPTCCVVDAQARCKLLNLVSPVGYNSCPFCTITGVHVGGSVHFPQVPPIAIPERRTDNSIKENMLQATVTEETVLGFKGCSQLMLMDNFDLGKGVVTDDLHPFSGVIQDHLEILMTRGDGRRPPPYYIGSVQDVRRIDSRMKSIRTPTHLSRKPRSLKVRSRWHGSDWRNFLLYYLVPVLDGILAPAYLRHFQLLAQAVFIVSRDIVTADDCNVAEHLFHEYVTKFQRHFGWENMCYNMHILLHVVECVRLWGPTYCHSTTHFESWNHELLKTITSPHATADQIVTRYLIMRFLNNIEDDEHISDRIKNKVRIILDNPLLRNAVIVGNVHLLGKCTKRPPSPQEIQLLLENNLNYEYFREFKRARFDGVEYRSCEYRFDGEVTKSDNSQIYLWDDEFGQILTIAVVGNHNHREVVLFIRIHNTNAHINRYICKVGEGPNEVVLRSFEDLRNLAILCTAACGTYVMPVANAQELD